MVPDKFAQQETSTDILARLMLEEKAEAQEKKTVERQRQAVKVARHQAADQDQLRNDNRRQANCDHLQGNHKHGEAPFKEVSHLSLHTYGGPSTSDNRRIRCNKCGFKWYPGDTETTLLVSRLRDNREPLPNPTGMSWKDAYKAVMRYKNQGNKPSTGFIDVIVPPPQPEV